MTQVRDMLAAWLCG